MKVNENFDPQNLQIVIEQEPVLEISQARYLGIEVDHFLNWVEHSSALIKKISKRKGKLRHGKDIFLQQRFSKCKKALLNHILDSVAGYGESAVLPI